MLEKIAHILSKNPTTQWQAKDFSAVDQLHLGGIPATLALLDWLPNDQDQCKGKDKPLSVQGLDIGCGLGGTSRLVWATRGYTMVGLDLNDSYIGAAKLLNQSIDPPPKCQFVVGNSLHLPFEAQLFGFVISQHASMNIHQKLDLLAGLYKVLKPQGQLLLHEVMLQPNALAADVVYPTPWAYQKDESHLCQWSTFERLAIDAGFVVEQFEDDTQSALAWIRKTRAQKLPPQPADSAVKRKAEAKPRFTPALALGPNAAAMSANVLANIEAGLLQVVSVSLRKV